MNAARIESIWYDGVVPPWWLRALVPLYRVLRWLARAPYALGLRRARRLPVPVVVVGNIAVGGTGKTPLVIALADALRERGFRPGVVSRGYGGTVRAPTLLDDRPDPAAVGDEPSLIRRRTRVPVAVGRSRAAAAALLPARGVDVIIADDGLQNLSFARDVEICVIDGERRFGNGLLLPSGPLREPVGRLATVDAVVVNGGDAQGVPGGRTFAMALGRERFAALASNEELSPEQFEAMARGRRVAAIAAIGHPPRFFEHLERLGVSARTRAYDDHHAFQPAELKLPGAEVIVMTEKDAVKCAAFADARMWFMRVDAILPPEFEDFLLTRIAQSRRSPHGPQAA